MTAPNAPNAEPVAYRLRTGPDRRKWQWMDGMPSVGATREAELHGWEIEYAYGAAAVAAMAEREAALVKEVEALRVALEAYVAFAADRRRSLGCLSEEMEAVDRTAVAALAARAETRHEG